MKYLKTFMGGLCMMAAVSCGGSSAENSECADACSASSSSKAVIENIMARRSIRKYKPQTVARDTMNIILECGINAPNGQNKQSWEVRVVDNPEFQNEIKALMATAGDERAAGCFYNADRQWCAGKL